MTPTQYKTERTKRGTQQAVADLLGVHQVTIARRETGALPITQEAAIALLAIPTIPRTQPHKTRRL
jgi:plasmid maintenance system antidote protein VapI